MDKRAFKNFITKRSSIWTLSLCMTGILVLGGIAAVDKTRRAGEEQQETEIGQVAYLEEEINPSDDVEEALFPTLEEDMTEDLAQASGHAVEDDLSKEDAGAAGVSAGADTDEEGQPSEDGNTPSAEASANPSEADTADGTDAGAADASTSDVVSDGADDTEEASSGQVISEQALLQAGVNFTEDDSLIWPAAGTILIDYSMDGSVYFPTLNQYKYNPALIIGSDVGNQVLASAKGIVESIAIDEETGNTVVLNLGNGYKLTYGQLKELAVAEGDVVEEGALLGYVSEPTKYYSEEGSNLYFAMTQNDAAVDPVLYLE